MKKVTTKDKCKVFKKFTITTPEVMPTVTKPRKRSNCNKKQFPSFGKDPVNSKRFEAKQSDSDNRKSNTGFINAVDIELMEALKETEFKFANLFTETLHLAELLFQEATEDTDEDDDFIDFATQFYENEDVFWFGNTRKGVPDEYVFFSQDSLGHIISRKTMRESKGQSNDRFKIELDVNGFDPENVHIDSVENRMTISMRKTIGTTPCKTFGILCPTVEALEKLCIHYPKNGLLVIEGVPKII